MGRAGLVRAALILLPVLLASVPLLAPVAALVVLWARGLRRPARTGLAVPTCVLVLTVALVSGVHAGASGSLWGLAAFVAAVLVLTAWSGLVRPSDAPDLARGAALVLILETGAATYQVLVGGAPRAAGTTFHPNVLGAVVAICGVWALGTWRRILGGRLATMLGPVTGILALGLLTAAPLALSGSRGAILGAAVGMGVLAVAHGRRGGRRRGALLVAGAAVLGVSVLAVALAPTLQSRWAALEGSLDPEGRLAIWGVAAQGIVERPLLGNGFGAWPRVAPATEPAVRIERMTSVHNAYLEVALAGGTLLSVAVGYGLASLFTALARAARTAGPVAVTAAAVLTGFLAHGLVESFFSQGALVALAWLPLSVALRRGAWPPT